MDKIWEVSPLPTARALKRLIIPLTLAVLPDTMVSRIKLSYDRQRQYDDQRGRGPSQLVRKAWPQPSSTGCDDTGYGRSLFWMKTKYDLVTRGFNATDAAFPEDRVLPALFEEQVEQKPRCRGRQG